MGLGHTARGRATVVCSTCGCVCAFDSDCKAICRVIVHRRYHNMSSKRPFRDRQSKPRLSFCQGFTSMNTESSSSTAYVFTLICSAASRRARQTGTTTHREGVMNARGEMTHLDLPLLVPIPRVIAVAHPRASEPIALAVRSLAFSRVGVVLDPFVLALAPKHPRTFGDDVKKVPAAAATLLALSSPPWLAVVRLESMSANAARIRDVSSSKFEAILKESIDW